MGCASGWTGTRGWWWHGRAMGSLAPTVPFVLYVMVVQVLCVATQDVESTESVSAKISDFGLALRALPLVNGRGWGAVWVPPRGTPRYMAPEFLAPTNGVGCVQVCCCVVAGGWGGMSLWW